MNHIVSAFTAGLGINSGQLQTDLREKILVVDSRSQGRRMLQWLTRQGLTLLNISVETPATLASAICQESLSQAGAPSPMAPAVAEGMILSLLRQQTAGFYATPAAQTPTVAKALYQTFLELTMAQVSDLSGSEKHNSTQALSKAYQDLKVKENRIDAGDMMTRAVALAPNAKRWQEVQFIILSSFAPSPLEQALLTAISHDNLTTITLPQGDATQHLDGKDCRFIACRGVETEVRMVLRDILVNKRPVEDCAVVYLSSAYATMLYKTAPRWDIPLTMGGGIGLQESLLFSTLETLADFCQNDFPVESLYKLLTTGACTPSHPMMLANLLTRQPLLWGQTAYTLTNEQRPDSFTDKEFKNWQDFLDTVLNLGNATLPDQKERLTHFLSHYVNLYRPGEAGAYNTVLDLLDSAAQVVEPFEPLLSRLLTLMDSASFLPNSTAPAGLLCLPLSQGLLSGRKTLYVVGLTRYALENGGSQSPILLDDERQALSPALATVDSRATALAEQFNQLIATHTGSCIFLRTNFDSGRMIEILPSTFFSTGLDQLGATEEVVDYLPQVPLTAGDYALQDPTATPVWDRATPVAKSAQAVDLPTIIKEMRYSASALEAALKCPLQFYLERILNLKEWAPKPPKANRWLENNTRGTFIHLVLELYYQEVVAGKTPDLDAIFKVQEVILKQENPCRSKEMVAAMERELPVIRDMIDGAVNWTTQSGHTVTATEQPVGTTKEPITLTIGNRKILFSGSIDRVDTYNGKTYLVDYKSGDARKFRDSEASHLQHYLYTIAYEQTHPNTTVDTASYLLLDGENDCVDCPQTKALRKEMEEKLLALLDFLGNESNMQTPSPCFTMTQGELTLGDGEQRQSAYGNCKNYCTYAAFCADIWEGGSVS